MRKRTIVLSALAALACSGAASATTYAFNQQSDTFQKGAAKVLSTNCPAGFFATGGGYSINDFAQQITYVTGFVNNGQNYTTGTVTVPALVVSLNQPTTGNGDGWAVGGVSNKDVAVTVYVMCASRS